MLADEPVYECDQRLASLGENERLHLLVPVELEAGGERGNPELAHRRVGRDDEFGGRLLKEHIEHAVLLLRFEATLFLARNQMLLEAFECCLRRAPELLLILHDASVTSWALRDSLQEERPLRTISPIVFYSPGECGSCAAKKSWKIIKVRPHS